MYSALRCRLPEMIISLTIGRLDAPAGRPGWGAPPIEPGPGTGRSRPAGVGGGRVALPVLDGGGILPTPGMAGKALTGSFGAGPWARPVTAKTNPAMRA